MKRYVTLVFALVVGLCAAGAQDGAETKKHPKKHLDQFMQQCMDANDNRPLCNCALKAFNDHVPAGAGRLTHHEELNAEVLQVDDSHLQTLAPEIEKCEAKFGKAQ